MEQTHQPTRQLPPPAALPLPRQRGWYAPLFGGVAEVLARLAEICLHPLIVLPLFFGVLGTTNLGIGGAVATVLAAGSVGMALAAPFQVDRWPNMRLYVLLGAVALQAIVLLILANQGERLATLPPLNGWPLLLLAIVSFGGGVAGLLRAAAAGIVRPEGSWRTRWGRWAVLGMIGTLLGGWLARNSLDRTGELFPEGFTRLFGIAGLALLATALLLAALIILQRVTSSAPVAPPSGPGTAFDPLALPDLLVNNLAYNRYIVFRVLYALGALADPFFIIYATRELGASSRAAATYLLTLALARAIGTLGWRAVSISAGNPMVVQLAAFVRLLAPITALTLPPLLGSATLRDRLPGGEAANLIAFTIVFIAWGAASAGLDLAAPAIQAAITTPRERPAATMATGLILALSAIALPLGGLIVDRLGYSFLFIAALVAGVATLLAGGLVDEPGAIVVRSAPTDRAVMRRRAPKREG
jgi:hypothetical protein